MHNPKSLRAEIVLSSITNPRQSRIFAGKVQGLLEFVCPGAHAQFVPERHKLVVTGIRTQHGVLLVKAVSWGVVEGMGLTLESSEFDLHDS